MLKRILTNETGVTILEGLIALGLLALVAGGSFAVLLSVSRQSSQPDIREEMSYAVEKANDELQLFTSLPETIPDEYPKGLCGNDNKPLERYSSSNPVRHNIACRLPPLCDKNHDSYFQYTVYDNQAVDLNQRIPATLRDGAVVGAGENSVPVVKIKFEIACNGYKL